MIISVIPPPNVIKERVICALGGTDKLLLVSGDAVKKLPLRGESTTFGRANDEAISGYYYGFLCLVENDTILNY